MKPGLLQEKPIQITTGLREGSPERELDQLDLYPYAKALTTFIQSCDTPMTVGLQGDWGTGKTSMLNMLRGSETHPKSGLLNSETSLIISFETWSYAQFNDRSSLPLACLYSLTKRLGDALSRQNIPHEKTNEATKGATGKLTAVLKKSLSRTTVGFPGLSIPVGAAVSEVLSDDEHPPEDLSQQMMEFRTNFSKMVDLWSSKSDKHRVVICVDDLDRVEPIIALELLESIKNFLDVDGCVFVLAVDYEVVQEGMKQKLGTDLQKTSGKSFFDKIIQLPFNMPKSSYKIGNYLKALVEEAFFTHAETLASNKNNIDFLLEITLCSIGGNPRSIKRVMNYARLLNIIRNENSRGLGKSTAQEMKILYSIICMQIAWPELFTHFMADPSAEAIQNLENWEYLESTPELRPLFDRTADAEALKNNISTFVDTLFSMIDEDGDGLLTDKEFAPVHKVLQMAKFTSVEIKPRPRDSFLATIRQNVFKAKDNNLQKFLEEVLVKSKLYTSGEIKYRPSGTRYVTLVYKRKQMGSIVSLGKRPLVIRLNGQPKQIMDFLEETNPQETQPQLVEFVRELEQEDGALTGFGDSFVNIEAFHSIDSKEQVKLLNSIITAMETLITVS